MFSGTCGIQSRCSVDASKLKIVSLAVILGDKIQGHR